MSDTTALAAAPEVEEVVVGTAHTTQTARNEAVEETSVAIVEPIGNDGVETNGEQQAEAEVVGTAHPTETDETGHGRLEACPTKEREEAIARIRKSNLPPVMRERLAAVMEASDSSYLDVAVCLEAIEETLPEFLRGGRGNFSPAAHPLGNSFFHGSDELTDAEAETLATKQLERSGLLRGQRVRVAD
jgi:hypothetical protein